MSNCLLEVCVDNPESLLNAIEGGADRLELCSALILGGMTPTIGFAKFAVSVSHIPCYALIRPRNGHFIFSENEIITMIQDMIELKKIGIDGFVIGALNKKNEIDINAIERLIETADGLDLTFHRAFDLTPDPIESMQTLINLGFKRILTSGQKTTAFDGVDLIRQLQKISLNKISIMAGAGINPHNSATIVKLTGIKEIHASCKKAQEDEGEMKNQSKVTMGINIDFDKQLFITDKLNVAKIKKTLSIL